MKCSHASDTLHLLAAFLDGGVCQRFPEQYPDVPQFSLQQLLCVSCKGDYFGFGHCTFECSRNKRAVPSRQQGVKGARAPREVRPCLSFPSFAGSTYGCLALGAVSAVLSSLLIEVPAYGYSQKEEKSPKL